MLFSTATLVFILLINNLGSTVSTQEPLNQEKLRRNNPMKDSSTVQYTACLKELGEGDEEVRIIEGTSCSEENEISLVCTGKDCENPTNRPDNYNCATVVCAIQQNRKGREGVTTRLLNVGAPSPAAGPWDPFDELPLLDPVCAWYEMIDQPCPNTGGGGGGVGEGGGGHNGDLDCFFCTGKYTLCFIGCWGINFLCHIKCIADYVACANEECDD